VQSGICFFDRTPVVDCGGGELVGPVKFALHVRAKLCDDAVQKFVL
jgi:hypothetical protein